MSELAISVEGLGKAYRIGTRRAGYTTFRETLMRSLTAPARLASSVLRREPRALPDSTVWALRNVSFDVKQGEVLGIIGRNGAGKSTLLKLLSRVAIPTEGIARIRGRVGSLLEVGTGFHPELTGRENVFLNGAILGMSRNEITRKFDEIVAFSEVEKFLDTPVKRYSSGMYLRLAFAVAAHLEPEVLVVDEVLAVGDASFQRKCLGKMEAVAGQGRTILFVSHNLQAITSLCSRAVLLEGGTVVTSGAATEVVSQYMAKVVGAAASVRWDSLEEAPGADGVKLIEVVVLDEDGQPLSTVNIERPTTVRITYHVAESRTFRLAAVFHTQGVCAFSTVEPVETVHEKTGYYSSSVAIPANTFSEGDYLLSISAFASRGKKNHHFKVNGCVAFQVYDPLTGVSARGDYRENLDGIVRPKLQWTTVQGLP